MLPWRSYADHCGPDQKRSAPIEACLATAAFADQVLVVDSGSTDNTVALSRQTGAEVFEYPDWQGFAVQRNRLIAHAKGDYIFFLDADELITPAFQKELQAIVQSNAKAVWQIQWRMVAYGHELKYYISRSKVERLFRRDMLKEYVGAVHEQAILHNEDNGHTDAPQSHLCQVTASLARKRFEGSLEKLTQYVMLGASKRAQAGKKRRRHPRLGIGPVDVPSLVHISLGIFVRRRWIFVLLVCGLRSLFPLCRIALRQRPLEQQRRARLITHRLTNASSF